MSEALVFQQPQHMRRIVLSFVARLAVPYFPILAHKRQDFRKKKKEEVTERQMCVLVFSAIISETFRILRRIHRDIVINIRTSWCNVAFVLVRF